MIMTINNRWTIIKIALLIVFVLLIFYWLLHRSSQPTLSPPAPKVLVQKPIQIKMGNYIIQTGNTIAFNSVNLVARVEGYLQDIKFIDGSIVKKGQELFIIEPEPYLDKVKEAQAKLIGQKANFDYASAEHARQQQMYKQNATSLKNVEKWAAKRLEAQAGIDNAQASLDLAKINYSYTQVLAPFDGRIGRHLVDIGNLVGHGEATQLATIEQIHPIYVYINLNELDLIKLRTAARAKGIKFNDINTIPVYVGMQNETGFPYEGKLDFVNTGLNASTGTMQFRALLPNKNYALVPGLFVQVRIPIGNPSMQFTVPDTTIQYDQIGAYVLVVNEHNLVLIKRVVLGPLEHNRQAITKGIEANDLVIVNGIQNATPGQAVTPKIDTTNLSAPQT